MSDIAFLNSKAEVWTKGYGYGCFGGIQKKWIVERIFSWLEHNRRLCRNYELIFDSAEEMVKIAAIRLLLKKI